MAKQSTARRKAGRPPLGPHRDKKSTLTTRITDELRQGLERAAAAKDRSLSQEIEIRLRESLEPPEIQHRAFGRAKETRALCVLVAQLVESIEMSAGAKWREDGYTCEAIRFALDIMLQHLRPSGGLKVPAQIAERFEKFPQFAEQYNEPKGLGVATVLGLIDQLDRLTDPPGLSIPANERYADGFYLFPKIRADLNYVLGEKK